jgi:hypothetical protein
MMAMDQNDDFGQGKKMVLPWEAPILEIDKMLSGDTHFPFKILIYSIEEFFSV